MKANKLMLAAMMIGAMAMVSCEKNQGTEPDTPVIPGGGDEAQVPELDPVEGACVLVVKFDVAPCNDVQFVGTYKKADGTAMSWNEDATHARFTPVEGFEGWYSVVVYPNDSADDKGFFIKGKPVQLGDGEKFNWSFQWARNSVTIVDGLFTLGYENGADETEGEPFIGFTETGTVATVTSSGWATDPCAAAAPAAAAWIKHASNEEGHPAWTAEPMDKVSEGVFTHTFVYADNGVNIGDTEECASWFPATDIEGLDVEGMAGKMITITFTSKSGALGTVSAKLAE